MSVEIHDFSISTRADGVGVLYEGHGTEAEKLEYASDDARLVIRLGLDGEWDKVDVDTGTAADVDVLERALSALTRVRAELLRMYGDEMPTGRCLTQGETGRCKERSRHSGDHNFPTDEEMKAEVKRHLNLVRARRKRSA